MSSIKKYTVAQISDAANAAAIRIDSGIYNTPLIPANQASRDTDSEVYFKAENFQLTGSFKLRGATNKLRYLRENSASRNLPMITASSGNHGIACAYAANAMTLGENANSTIEQEFMIVLPTTVSPLKLERIRSLGARVILFGDETGEAELHAMDLADREGYVYISPYNDREIIAGQATIGLEILDDMQDKPVDNIFIAMGGGGLISGVGSVLKHRSAHTKIWGVAADNSAALAASLKAGKVIDVDHLPTLADGVSGGMDHNSITFPLAQQVVDEIVRCSEEEIETAFRIMALGEHQIVEGSAALALAALYKVSGQCSGQNNVILLCASNIAESTVLRLLKLS